MESTKIQLFDNNEDPNDEFELKLDILSDHKTSKLIELKSKFAHDSRFNIDERFLDNDHDDESQLKGSFWLFCLQNSPCSYWSF